MAISIGKLVLVFIFLILSVEMPSCLAKEYVVGDKRGWSPGVDYHPWAYGKSFRVGDVLHFFYTPKVIDVASVDISSYALCDSTIKTFYKDNSGQTSITLEKSGPYYFISTNKEGCFTGLKLELHVL
ncbi:blue copper protein-like [Solanum dulcamara]|uniref:blue copper protein-like n=1 Tax=Solanum dulcamara TaxID=45834 RepID=UPI002486C70A|nr:blue copper protein-like [Solanum dulcamara]